MRRAGTDFWKHVTLSEFDSWESFLEDRKPARDRLYLFEELGPQSVYAQEYQEDAYWVFGSETNDLPRAILDGMDDRMFHLPMRNPLVWSRHLATVATADI